MLLKDLVTHSLSQESLFDKIYIERRLFHVVVPPGPDVAVTARPAAAVSPRVAAGALPPLGI